jgi:hypothetical protein
MNPEAIYYVIDDYINQVLLVFNFVLFISLIKNRKNADPIIWGLFLILNLLSSLDSICGLYFHLTGNLNPWRIFRINYVVCEWIFLLLFFYLTEKNSRLKSFLKYLVYSSLICITIILIYNYFYSKYNDLYISDFKFFSIVPLTIYRFFEFPKHSKFENVFLSPSFYINVAIFQLTTLNFTLDLFRLSIYNFSKDIYFINVFISWLSYFAFFSILAIAFSKYSKKNELQ